MAIGTLTTAVEQFVDWACDKNNVKAHEFQKSFPGKVLTGVDFLAGVTALVVGLLALYSGMIPMCDFLAGLLIGGGAVNILATFLKTYQENKKALLKVEWAKCCESKSKTDVEREVPLTS